MTAIEVIFQYGLYSASSLFDASFIAAAASIISHQRWKLDRGVLCIDR
jgi:hypothetical protein